MSERATKKTLRSAFAALCKMLGERPAERYDDEGALELCYAYNGYRIERITQDGCSRDITDRLSPKEMLTSIRTMSQLLADKERTKDSYPRIKITRAKEGYLTYWYALGQDAEFEFTLLSECAQDVIPLMEAERLRLGYTNVSTFATCLKNKRGEHINCADFVNEETANP